MEGYSVFEKDLLEKLAEIVDKVKKELNSEIRVELSLSNIWEDIHSKLVLELIVVIGGHMEGDYFTTLLHFSQNTFTTIDGWNHCEADLPLNISISETGDSLICLLGDAYDRSNVLTRYTVLHKYSLVRDEAHFMSYNSSWVKMDNPRCSFEKWISNEIELIEH